MIPFKSWPKTPRLENLHLRITQKLNGTNGVIAIDKSNAWLDKADEPYFKVGSRTQWLPSPEEIKQRAKEINEWATKKHEFETLTQNYISPSWLEENPKPPRLNDNHGFSKWAHENKEDLIDFLGEGYHYGEWCGPGIQNGEGLTERGFYLFSPIKRYIKKDEQFINGYIDTVLYRENKFGLHFVPELFNGCLNGEGVDILLQYYTAQLKSWYPEILAVPPEGMIVEIEDKLRFKIIFE